MTIKLIAIEGAEDEVYKSEYTFAQIHEIVNNTLDPVYFLIMKYDGSETSVSKIESSIYYTGNNSVEILKSPPLFDDPNWQIDDNSENNNVNKILTVSYHTPK